MASVLLADDVLGGFREACARRGGAPAQLRVELERIILEATRRLEDAPRAPTPTSRQDLVVDALERLAGRATAASIAKITPGMTAREAGQVLRKLPRAQPDGKLRNGAIVWRLSPARSSAATAAS